jgi:hypothetical protein
MKKASAAHEKAKTAGSKDDREAYAREAIRHASNAKEHLSHVTEAHHQVDASRLARNADKTHASASAIASKATAEKVVPKTPDKVISKVAGPMGPFAAEALAKNTKSPSQKIQDSRSHLDQATKHMTNHDAEGASGADKVRHAMSALDSARSAIKSARASGHQAAYHVIQEASHIAQSARSTIAGSDTSGAKSLADKARHYSEVARKSSESASTSSGTAQKLHQLAAEAARSKARKAARESVKHFETTGEGLSHYEEMRAVIGSRKSKTKRRTS